MSSRGCPRPRASPRRLRSGASPPETTRARSRGRAGESLAGHPRVNTPEAIDAAGLVTGPWPRFHVLDIFRLWRETPEDLRGEFPLLPIIGAWQNRPREVELERRRDRRILPRIVASGDPPEREAGMLFGGLHEGRSVEAPELPLWPDVAPAKRVPLLDLVDAAGLPVMTEGRGAPLPLRLFVRALASVRLEHRRLVAVRIAPTLRELCDGLFPNGWRKGKDWPRLRDALLHARDYAIPRRTGLWFPVALRSHAGRPPA